MIEAILCNTCNQLMGIVSLPADNTGSSGGNIPMETTYHCNGCNHSITVKQKTMLY